MPRLLEITRCSASLSGLHLRCSVHEHCPRAMWLCSAINTLPCRAPFHLLAPTPSQNPLAGSWTSRFYIIFRLPNAGALKRLWLYGCKDAHRSDDNFAWRRPCKRVGSRRTHAGRWSARVAWYLLLCRSYVPVYAVSAHSTHLMRKHIAVCIMLCASARRAARAFDRSRYDDQASRGTRTVHAQSRTLRPTRWCLALIFFCFFFRFYHDETE